MPLNLKNNLLNNRDLSRRSIKLARKLSVFQEQTLNCTCCGACLQGCISYKTRNMENFSPRGRVQLLKFLLERKIALKKNEEMLLACINSCIQCGQCSEFCAADLRTDKFVFELKSFFIKPSFRTSYLKFYQKYAKFLFFFFTLGRKIKQAKKKKTKTLLITSKAGLKFAKASLALLEFARVSKKALYINEALYSADKNLLSTMLKNLKEEVNSFNEVKLITDNIILWRFLKNQEGFEQIKFILPKQKLNASGGEVFVINNNSFKEKEEQKYLSCLNANFFVEFRQELLNTPANLFWRALSLEEEQSFTSALKKFEGKTLLALCGEDKIFYDRLKKKHKVKLNIFTLAQFRNEQERTR